MLEGFLGESIIRRAREAGLVQIRLVNLRDFTSDRHRTTDDRPYGGGPGMVMKPEPIFRAVEKVKSPRCRIILMTPQGERFTSRGRWSCPGSDILFSFAVTMKEWMNGSARPW